MFGFDSFAESPFSALPIAAANNYSLTASAGSYAVTGQSATLLRSKLLTANNGSYSVTGQSSTILRSKVLLPSAGSYSVTGQAATLVRNRQLTSSAGNYTVSGQSASIVYTPITTGYTINALNGSYSVTGESVAITWSGAPAPAVVEYFVEIRSFTERRRF